MIWKIVPSLLAYKWEIQHACKWKKSSLVVFVYEMVLSAFIQFKNTLFPICTAAYKWKMVFILFAYKWKMTFFYFIYMGNGLFLFAYTNGK